MSEYIVETQVGDTVAEAFGSSSTPVIEVYQGGPGLDGRRGLKIGDISSPLSRRGADTAKVKMSVTQNVFDGYDGLGPVYAAQQSAFMDAVWGNWRTDTVIPYSSSQGYNQTGPGGSVKPFDFETVFEGDYCAFACNMFGGYNQDCRFWVDDEPIVTWQNGTFASGPVVNDDVIRSTSVAATVMNMKFTQRGTYRIRASIGGYQATGGIFLHNGNQNIQRGRKPRYFGVISDSYFDGGLVTTQTPASIIGAELGMMPWNMAQGGSGFVNPSGNGASGDRSYPSDQVFAMLAKAPDLQFLIVNGSGNDLGYTDAQVEAAMKSFFARVRQVRPNLPVIWVGIEPVAYFENLYTAAGMIAREEKQRQWAMREPNCVGSILTAKENWLTGTGYEGATNGSGNQDLLVSIDGVHLNKYGTRWFGRMVAERIKQMPAYLEAVA